MPVDDFMIAAAAAERVLRADIAAHVPAMFQGKIPADAVSKTASEIARAVVDDLAKAHAADAKS